MTDRTKVQLVRRVFPDFVTLKLLIPLQSHWEISVLSATDAEVILYGKGDDFSEVKIEEA